MCKPVMPNMRSLSSRFISEAGSGVRSRIDSTISKFDSLAELRRSVGVWDRQAEAVEELLELRVLEEVAEGGVVAHGD